MIKLNRITLFSLLGVISLGSVLAQPQVVTLRHPESNQNSVFGLSNARPSPPVGSSPSAPASIPTSPQRARYSAKPGDVVVHFDRHHEIQRLQYVLQNGQLATLYQSHTATGRIPTIQVQPQLTDPSKRDDVGGASGAKVAPSGDQQPGPSQQRQQQPLAPPALQQPFSGFLKSMDYPAIDPAETIEILNSRMDSVGHLVGDHTTIPMPDHQLTGEDDPKLDILATVAADAIHNGAQMGEAKLHKAGLMLNKLKAKVSQKLRELPNIVDSKLRAKSSQGQVFLDQPNNKIVVIDDDESEPPSPLVPMPEGAKIQPVSPTVKSLLDEVTRQQQANNQQ